MRHFLSLISTPLLVSLLTSSLTILVAFDTQASEAPAFVIERIDTDLISYTGKITAESASALQAQLNPQTKRLRITSSGGDPIEAMRMGRIIQQQGLELIVDRYCVESCAQYLFFASITKSVNKHSLLGFVQTRVLAQESQLRDQFLKREVSIPDLAIVDAKSVTAEQKQLLEWSYFQSLGLPPNLLRLFDQQLRLAITTEVETNKSRNQNNASSFSAIEDIAVPTRVDRQIMRASRPRDQAKPNIQLEQAVYFPNLNALQELGVKGVGEFSFPQNTNDARQLFHAELGQIKAIAFASIATVTQ